MPNKKSKFVYDGPVTAFGQLLINKWHGETWAVSEAKALSNLSYQFKTETNRVPGTRIELSADHLREASAYYE